jgi:alginate production protein
MTPRLLAAFAVSCGQLAAAQALPVPAFTQSDTATSAVPVRRPDERRSDQPLTIGLFGKSVGLGLSYELTQERRLDFDLDRTDQRGRDVREHELKLDARWRTGESATWFVQAVGLAERRQAIRDGAVTHESAWERGQTWLLLESPGGLPLTLQAGRIALIERRSWWWDDDLDAMRLGYVSPGPTAWRIDTGIARELLKVASADPGIAPEQKGVTRWFGHAQLPYAADHSAEAFWLMTRDRSGVPAAGTVLDEGMEDGTDGRLRWFGLRARGDARVSAGHRLYYRADVALLRGEETRTPFDETAAGALQAGLSSTRRVRAHAWDLGVQWRLPGNARPTLSLALARGSGGMEGAAEDRDFRQTGLQENKGRIAGVKRIRFYGELLDPELSNLSVASIGFGLRGLSNSSAELLLHHYRQGVASVRLAGSRLSQQPQGRCGWRASSPGMPSRPTTRILRTASSSAPP